MAKRTKPNSSKPGNSRNDFKGNPKKQDRNTKSRRGSNHKNKTMEENLDYDQREQRSTTNDPGMWMRLGTYSEQAAKISTYNATGAPLLSPVAGDYWTIPGIYKFDYIPFFGNVTSYTSPLNKSARVMYDFINSKNSRNPSYDPNDVMIYVIAVANAWALHSTIQRVVGMYGGYNVENRYWFESVVKTMGFDPAEVTGNITAWRNVLNKMAMDLNKLSVPNGMEYFNRAIQMCRGIYADADNLKASICYFMPQAFFKYTYSDTDVKMSQLSLDSAPWHNAVGVTAQEVQDYFDSLTANLFMDNDINTIGSDILKAFGPEQMFKLPMVSEDYREGYGYNPVISLQLHNAMVCEYGEEFIDSYMVTQDMTNGCLVADSTIADHPTMACNWWRTKDREGNQQHLLDFWFSDPTPTDVTEATRLMYWWAGDAIQAVTELLTKATAYRFEAGTTTGSWNLVGRTGITNIGVANNPTGEQALNLVRTIDCATKFYRGPISYLIYQNAGSSQYSDPPVVGILSDLDNFTTIDVQFLRNLGEACTRSVFYPLPKTVTGV